MILNKFKEKDEEQELKVGSFKRCENILEREFSLKKLDLKIYNFLGERPVREQEPVHGGGQPLQSGRHGENNG